MTGFNMHACVTLPHQLVSNFGKTKADLKTVITISPWWSRWSPWWSPGDHFSLIRTSTVMVWRVPLSRSKIRGGQPPTAPSLGATLSVRAPQATASRTHRLTLKTKRKIDLETMSSFSKLSVDEFGTTGVKDFHIWSKSQDWSKPQSPQSYVKGSQFRDRLTAWAPV